MAKLYILIGMIASGKSTWSRMAAAKGDIIVSDDDVVNMVHGGDYTLYDPSLKLLYKSTENHIIQTGLAMGRNVIVDRGLNISDKTRKRFIAMAKSVDVPVVAVEFTKSSAEEHARRRFTSDARGYDYQYWLGVAKRHEAVYMPPSQKEGFDEILKSQSHLSEVYHGSASLS